MGVLTGSTGSANSHSKADVVAGTAHVRHVRPERMQKHVESSSAPFGSMLRSDDRNQLRVTRTSARALLEGGAVGFLDKLKGDSGPRRYEIAGHIVVCSHCGGEEFDERSALLNTAGMTFLDIDWANRQAVLLVCAVCGRIEWFLDPE